MTPRGRRLRRSIARCAWCDGSSYPANAVLVHDDGRTLHVHEQSEDTCADQYLDRYGAEGWTKSVKFALVDDARENKRRRRASAEAVFRPRGDA